MKKIAELMEVSFKQRRDDIMRKILVTDVKKKYCFLLQAGEVCKILRSVCFHQASSACNQIIVVLSASAQIWPLFVVI